MVAPRDVWYTRLPDGRVLRARSTEAVRHHLESGRIPADSRVRRSGEQAWAVLERTGEFADLAKIRPRRRRRPRPAEPARARPGSNALKLQAVGVRGCVAELLGALDGTLVRGKLRAAGLLGASAAVVLLLAGYFRPGQD